MLFYQTTWHHIQDDSNADENVMSHKKWEVPLHDNMSFTKDSN